MTKKISALRNAVFCAVELILFILILTLKGEVVTVFQFISVAFAFSFSLQFVSIKEKQYFIQIAMLFTVMADIFLVLVKPQNQVLAMCFFSVTQITYFLALYIKEHRKKVRLLNLILRLLATILVIVVAVIVLKEKFDFLSVISLFYFVNLVFNVVFAFFRFKKNSLMAIGLLLFMFCDVFVGLQSAIGVYIDVPQSSLIYKIVFSSFNWVWFFYVPSQTLLALSCQRDLNKK